MYKLERYDFCGWEKSVQVCLLNEKSPLQKNHVQNFLLYFLHYSFCLGKN